MRTRHLMPALLSLGVAAIITAKLLIAADNPEQPPQSPPPSTYAPADDLIAQVDYYIHRADETLAMKDEFDDAARNRLEKDAHTITAVALTLGLHDSHHTLSASAPALLKAADQLADAKDYDAAKTALTAMKTAISGQVEQGTAAQGAPLKWGSVAPMDQLMAQVANINSALKRGLTPQRFSSLQKQSAAQAATLAAIAQTVLFDDEPVKNRAELDKWYRFSADMRDAAGAVNKAIHAGDQPSASTAMAHLANSCEACHAVFRKDSQ